MPSSSSPAPAAPARSSSTDRVGVVRPAHCTALGKIILASLRPEQLKRVHRSRGTEAVDAKVDHRCRRVLMREIAEVQRTGVAFDDGEFNMEVRCVAVPVTDFTGQVIGALGISGPIWRCPNQSLHAGAQVGRPQPTASPRNSAPRTAAHKASHAKGSSRAASGDFAG